MGSELRRTIVRQKWRSHLFRGNRLCQWSQDLIDDQFLDQFIAASTEVAQRLLDLEAIRQNEQVRRLQIPRQRDVL